jgi:hypothetical protein
MDDAELKRVAEAATPGPWAYELDDEGCSMGWIVSPCERIVKILGDSAQQATNATYIATFDPPTVLGLLSRLSAAEGEIARRDAVAQASWGDQKDEHTEAIRAAHPIRTDDFETYDTAMAMIGTRHGKYELVNLVNWLLVRAKTAEAVAASHPDSADVSYYAGKFREAEARVGVLEEALRALVDAIDYREDEHGRRSYAIVASMPRAFHGARAALTQEPSHEPE